MRAEKVSAELSQGTIYWLASGRCHGRLIVAEGDSRGDAARKWRAMAEAHNVYCLPPRRRYAISSVDLLP